MSMYNVPYVASLPPMLDSPYIAGPSPMMHEHQNASIHHPASPHLNFSSPSPSMSSSNRISKAKKGKRVHACEYPGCDKVFTRAEHRRRHELGHRSKKLYQCSYEGCSKAFHRPDYLTQHLAKHAPNPPKAESPSVESTTASSPALSVHKQQPPPLTSESPVTTGAQSEAIQTPPAMWTGMPVPLLPCSQCPKCQTQIVASVDGNSFYTYPPEMSESGMPQDAFVRGQFPPAPMSVGLATVIDQYMRGVLKPDGLPSPQSPQMGSPFLGSQIDPSLAKMPHPTSYSHPYASWAETEGLSYDNQPVHHMGTSTPTTTC